MNHRSPNRPAASATRPIDLEAPPRYLAQVPDGILRPNDYDRRSADNLLGWLVEHGIHARPSLAQVEAERVRRGFRTGVEVLQ